MQVEALCGGSDCSAVPAYSPTPDSYGEAQHPPLPLGPSPDSSVSAQGEREREIESKGDKPMCGARSSPRLVSEFQDQV